MLHCVNLKRHVALLIIKLLHKVNQGYTAKTNEIMSRVLFLKSTDYCTVNFCSPLDSVHPFSPSLSVIFICICIAFIFF